MKKLRKWFTLIEMIIVIVIIGILAAAILPKILWARDRANDVKRIADLRNVAMAVEMYHMDNGEYPRISSNPSWRYRRDFVGSVSDLKPELEGYISELPKDPQKNSYVNIITTASAHNFVLKNNNILRNGEYLYQLGTNTYRWSPDFVLLIAKVQTANSANYILGNNAREGSANINPWWGFWMANHPSNSVTTPAYYINNWPHLCSSIKQVAKGSEVFSTKDNNECAYSSEDQLYYILKVQ